MKRAILLLIGGLASGCVEVTEPPRIAAAQLNGDDLKVLGVALNAVLDATATAGVVTPDWTIRVCDLPEFQPFGYECMGLDDLAMVNGYIRELFGYNAPAIFQQRNRVANRIRGDVDGVQVVPGEALLNLLQERWESEFPALFPGKQGVVIFSSPTYPARGQAVVYVLHVVRAAAFVHLGREGTDWKVKSTRGLWVS